VLDLIQGTLQLVELAPGVSVDEVRTKTEPEVLTDRLGASAIGGRR
jgi:acyl CoA:acetate/3-ketoacid CoA transferase beta subunit